MQNIYCFLDRFMPFEWLEYDFMKNALIAIIIISPLFGILGTMIVNNKLAFFSDALGHSVFTGMSIGIIIGAIILIAGVVFIQQAERRVPVQYSKKVVGRKMVGAQNTHIPLKLAMAGVMPIIFASSFLTFPAMLISIFAKDVANLSGFWAGVYKFSIATSSSSVGIGYTIANALIYLVLIMAFTFFYTYATFNPAEVSNNIKKNGRSTKYTHTIKTCNGRSYANNICIIILNIPSNDNTNICKRCCNTNRILVCNI